MKGPSHTASKRLLATLLSVSLLCSTLPAGSAAGTASSAAATPYNDTQTHWAKAAIDTWSEYGVLQGYNHMFRPDAPITRGELAVVLDRVMDYGEPAAPPQFSDLDQNFYTDAVRRVAGAGVLQGAYGMARPNDSVTREEAAVLLARAFGLSEETTSAGFTDQASISSWASGSVAAMKNRGYLKGTPSGAFLPQDSVTRAELVTMLDGCVASYITTSGTYTIDEPGIVIVHSSPVTIKESTLSDNLIASGTVTADGAVSLVDTTVAGRCIAVSGNNDVFRTEKEKPSQDDSESEDQPSSRPVDLHAVEGDLHVRSIEGSVITLAYGTSVYELTKGIEDLDKYKYEVTDPSGATKTGDLETGDLLKVTSDGGRTYTIEVLPETAVTSIQISRTTLTMAEGDTVELEATVSPADATDPRVLWATSNARVADMDDGVVTATGAGTAVLTATTMDGALVAECSVTVTEADVAVTSVKISQNAMTLAPGEAGQLGAYVLPEFAHETGITWSSSDPTVAQVQDGGYVVALTEGSAKITATSVDGGKTAVCELTVTRSTTPANVTAVEESITDTTVLLQWDKQSSQYLPELESYSVYCGSQLMATAQRIGKDQVEETYPTMGCKIEGLEPETTYTFTVVANHTDGTVSQPSEPVTVTTAPAPTAVLDVSKAPYHAVADGTTVNTAAIQQAIDDCPAGGVVYIPQGTFMTGSLFLHSDMTLKVDGTLLGSLDVADYPVVASTFEGWEMNCFASLINIGYRDTYGGYNTRNVVICGSGEINGNGFDLETRQETLGPAQKEAGKQDNALAGQKGYQALGYSAFNDTFKDSRVRGKTLITLSAQDIYVTDVTISSGPSWTNHLVYSDSITYDGVKVIAKYGEQSEGAKNKISNGDGIDPESSSNINIFNCYFYTGDDCVAIKAGKNLEGYNRNKPSENIRVTSCYDDGSDGAFVVGSEMSGGVRNILYQDNELENVMWDTLYVKLTEDRGGLVTNLTLKDADMRGCQRAVRIERYDGNGDGLPAPVPASAENILIENIYGFTDPDVASPDVPISISGFDNGHFTNLHLKDLNINGSFRWYPVEKDGVVYDTITSAYVNNVDNSTFENVVLNGNQEPQWMITNCTGITGIDPELILPLGINYQGENTSYYQLAAEATGAVLAGDTDDKNPLQVLNNAQGCKVLEVTGSGVTYTMPKVPAGSYQVMFDYYQNGSAYGTVTAQLDGGVLSAQVNQSGADERLCQVNMGLVEFQEDGQHTFTVTLNKGSKFTVDQINLVPSTASHGFLTPDVYTAREMKDIRIQVDSGSFADVKSVGFSLRSETGNTLVGSGNYYDAESGLFVLPEETFVLDSESENGVYALELPQPVYMTMEAGRYYAHIVGYSDAEGTVPVAGAEWNQTITLDVPPLKTDTMEIYPSNAQAMPSQEFLDLRVNGTPIFIEQEYNDHSYYNDGGLDTRLRPKTHIARLAASYDEEITVQVRTSKPLANVLVRPERLVKDVTVEGDLLSFTVVSNAVHPELGRNLVITAENTDTVNTDASLNPHANQELYADFNLLIDDMEQDKPVPGGNVINLLDLVPDIDRTGRTIVTDAMNDALAQVAGVKGFTAEADRKTLYIPYGIYQCGTLNLPTNAKVYLDSGAYIVGTGNYQDYPQTEKLPEQVILDNHELLQKLGLDTAYYAQQGNDNGEYMSYSRQLLIDEADQTTLFGRGTVDSNGWELACSRRDDTQHGDVWEMKDGTKLRAWVDAGNNSLGWYTTETLRIQDSTNIEIRDVLLRNSPSWTVHPLRCDQLNITGVKVVNDVDCGSDDGFDVDSSSNVVLDRIFYNGNDDAFVMKTTGTANGRMYEPDGTLSEDIPYTADHQLYAAPTHHVWAQNSTLLTRMNTANRIGTEENAVSVHDIHYVNNDCLDNLVCISITPKDDAEIYDIYFENNIYDRPKVLFEIGALVRNNGATGTADDYDPDSNYLNYNGFTNPGEIDYKSVLPWYDRYDPQSPRFDTMGYFHDIYIRNNTIQNYTYMGYDGGFGGSAYQIIGPEFAEKKVNNADLSNVPTHGQIMDNVTISNILFRDAVVYEMIGYGKDHNDENGLLIYGEQPISTIENMYWGSREFTELMPIADPVSPRINNLDVYSDQAPSVMLVSPAANLQCAPNKIENKYMRPYITIRTLYSTEDLRNIEVFAVPARGGELEQVYVSVKYDGRYLTADGQWTAEETYLSAQPSSSGNYVLTLSDSVLAGLSNGMYTLATYAVGRDGVSSGKQTVNYNLEVDSSTPLPPNNVHQAPSARTFDSLDVVWDNAYDYQPGDTYNVYYGPLNSDAIYDKQEVEYNMPYSGNGENGYYASRYSVYDRNLEKMSCVENVTRNNVTLTGLNPRTAYVVYVTAVRDGVESPLSKWAIANTKAASPAGTVNILDYGASPDSPDNTEAIQAAIDACPANGTVVVPAGTFITGALFLSKDHITLQLEEGAVLKAFTDFGDDPTPQVISQHYPYIRSSFEGIEHNNIFAGLINVTLVESETVEDGIRKVNNLRDYRNVGQGVCDVSIIGSGTIDAQGHLLSPAITKALGKPADNNAKQRSSTINVINASYVYMNGFTVQDSPCWTVHMLYSKDLSTNGVIFRTNLTAEGTPNGVSNTDGWDPDSSENCYLYNADSMCGDDHVAIKSGKNGKTSDNDDFDEVGNGDGVSRAVASKNIRVTDCHFGSGGGMAIGSEQSGGVSGVFVQNVVFDGTDRGIQIKAQRGRVGYVRDVVMDQLSMKGLNNFAIALNMRYYDNSLTMEPTDPPTVFEDITFSNLTVEIQDGRGAAATGIQILGLPESPVRNVRFLNCTMECDVSVVAIDAAQLTFENVEMTANTKPAFVNCTDVSDGITGFFPPPAASELITDLMVSDSINQANWYVQNNLQPWSRIYSDLTGYLVMDEADWYPGLMKFPDQLKGLDYIKVPYESRLYTGDELARFTMGGDGTVYVAYDDTDHPQTPEWLRTWTKTDLQFQIGMFEEMRILTMTVYEKSFRAGDTVVLGTNGGASNSDPMYLILVKGDDGSAVPLTEPATDTGTETATPPAGGESLPPDEADADSRPDDPSAGERL